MAWEVSFHEEVDLSGMISSARDMMIAYSDLSSTIPFMCDRRRDFVLAMKNRHSALRMSLPIADGSSAFSENQTHVPSEEEVKNFLATIVIFSGHGFSRAHKVTNKSLQDDKLPCTESTKNTTLVSCRVIFYSY
nr:unnamed protein product [Callosobruchus chinensis]